MKKTITTLLITLLTLNLCACHKKADYIIKDYTTLDEINIVAKTNIIGFEDVQNPKYQIIEKPEGTIAKYSYRRNNIDYVFLASMIPEDISGMTINDEPPFRNNTPFSEITKSDNFLGASFHIGDIHYCLICEDPTHQQFKDEVKDIYRMIKGPLAKDNLVDLLFLEQDNPASENIGYAFIDLDDDENEELLIGDLSFENEIKPINRIYSFDGHDFYCIKGGKDDCYYLTIEGYLLEESGDNKHFWIFKDNTLKEIRKRDYHLQTIDFIPLKP